MLVETIAELGFWNWIILGVVLLVLEIVVSGVFLLWIGVAALITGIATRQLDDYAFWTWQVQIIAFLLLAVASVVLARSVWRRRKPSDQPLLNRRAEQLVGRLGKLTTPISQGVGRARLGDTTWRVTGPDLPVGATVRIVEVRDGELVAAAVEPTDSRT